MSEAATQLSDPAAESLARSRASLNALVEAMRALPEEALLSTEPENWFAPGLYARVLYMPADSVWVSKIHKTEHLCICLRGVVTVVIDGEEETVVGPRIMRTLPGTQRAVYVHEDAAWITFHPTDKTDVAEIEPDIYADTWDDLERLDHSHTALGETS